jgi:hypothetical protein
MTALVRIPKPGYQMPWNRAPHSLSGMLNLEVNLTQYPINNDLGEPSARAIRARPELICCIYLRCFLVEKRAPDRVRIDNMPCN